MQYVNETSKLKAKHRHRGKVNYKSEHNILIVQAHFMLILFISTIFCNVMYNIQCKRGRKKNTEEKENKQKGRNLYS